MWKRSEIPRFRENGSPPRTFNTVSRPSSAHVAIVGGGPAGAAATLALLNHGFAVTLIERSDYADLRIGEHLTPDAVPDLAHLDVLQEVQNGAHWRCHGVRSAWGESVVRDNAYIFSPYGDGFNLSRPAFDAMLAKQAERRGAAVLKKTRLVTLTRNNLAYPVITHTHYM